ncbi:MAG: hypothetical protein E6H63_03240 [Betaproteobacteria bacterium]|nr:MAG: hypothetical protein E6H63_03240 [Betaproteobacteria bacterium]
MNSAHPQQRRHRAAAVDRRVHGGARADVPRRGGGARALFAARGQHRAECASGRLLRLQAHGRHVAAGEGAGAADQLRRGDAPAGGRQAAPGEAAAGERALGGARAPLQHRDGRAARDVSGRRDAAPARRRDLRPRPAASRARGCAAPRAHRQTQLSAALAVRKFREVRVWSPRRESREAFVAEWRGKLGATIGAVESAEACVEAADVIAAATSSMVRVIEPRWLKPGMHVSCIKTQEVDAEVLQRCDRVVLSNRRQAKHYDNVMKDTPNVKAESARGWWNDGSVRVDRYPDLADVLTERAPGRDSDREITCFVNNVGTGLQFAAAGAYVLARARAERVGTELPDDWFTEDVHP